MVGLVAIGYAELIDYGHYLFTRLLGYSNWLPLFITPLVTVLSVWLARRLFPGAEGSGIPQVIACLENPRHGLGSHLLTLRIAIGKIGLSFVAALGGLTLGRAGPTVHVGAALMYNLRHIYPRSNTTLDQRLTLAGAAAGLSAAFNAPLAGIMFAIEDLLHGFSLRTSQAVLIAITIAGVVSLDIRGNYIYFSVVDINDFSDGFLMLMVIVAIGLLTGISGGIFVWLALNTQRWMPAFLQQLRNQRPLCFAACCGLAVALIGISTDNNTYGGGHEQVTHLLGNSDQQPPVYFPFVKMVSLLLSYLPGVPGGILSPSLSIGAGLAKLLQPLFATIPLPNLITLGMVGYMAASTRAPLTAFVIVMEMIDGHQLVIAMMATGLIASGVSSLFVERFYTASAKRYFP